MCTVLLQELKPYNLTGFYQDEHYRKVDEQGSTDVCLLLNDKSQLHPSLEPPVNVEDVLFLARVLSINGGLPEEVLRRCDQLSMSAHDNVANFLGLIVEEHVRPLMPSVAHIFEEYAEGGWRQDCIIHYYVYFYTFIQGHVCNLCM